MSALLLFLLVLFLTSCSNGKGHNGTSLQVDSPTPQPQKGNITAQTKGESSKGSAINKDFIFTIDINQARLKKLTPDGTLLTDSKLEEMIQHAVVCSKTGNLYFIDSDYNICEYLENGKNEIIVPKTSSRYFDIIGDSIYYVSSDSLWKCDLDGQHKEQILDEGIWQFYIYKDNIFFSRGGSEGGIQSSGIYEYNMQTKSRQMITDKKGMVIKGIVGNKLLYADLYYKTFAVYAYDLLTQYTTVLDIKTPIFIIYQNKIYFADSENNLVLCSISVDGNDKKQLADFSSVYLFQFADSIYACPDDGFTGYQRYCLSTGKTEKMPEAFTGIGIPFSTDTQTVMDSSST